MTDAQSILLQINGSGDLASVLEKDSAAFQQLRSSAQESTAAGATGFGVMSSATDKATESTRKFGETNMAAWSSTSEQMGSARAQMENFNSKLSDTTSSVTGGLTPAMQGIPTEHLQTLGMNMDEVGTKTGTSTSAVERLSNAFTSLQGIGGMALSVLGASMLTFATTCISAAESVTSSFNIMAASMGLSYTSGSSMMDLANQWSAQTGVSAVSYSQGASKLGTELPTASASSIEGLMPYLGGMSVGTGEDVSQLSQMIGNAVNMGEIGAGKGNTSAMRYLARMGVGETQLDTGAQELFGKDFDSLDADQKLQAITQALKDTGKAAGDSAANVNSASGKMSIMSDKLKELEAEIGDALVNALWTLEPLLEGLVDLMKNPIFAQIVADFLLIGGAVGTVVGPLMMFGVGVNALRDGINGVRSVIDLVKGGFDTLKNAILNDGVAAEETAVKEDTLATSEKGVGTAAVTETGEEDTLAGSEATAGGAAATEAGEEDTLAVSEGLAGAGAAGAGVGAAGGGVLTALGTGGLAVLSTAAGIITGGVLAGGTGIQMAEGEHDPSKAFMKNIGAMESAPGDMYSAFSDNLSKPFQGGIWDLLKGSGGTASAAGGDTSHSFQKDMTDIEHSAQQSVEHVTGFFTSLPGKIGGALNSFSNTVRTGFNNDLKNAETVVGTGINTVINFFSTLPGKVLAFAGNFLSAAVTDAQNIVSGIENTITSLPGIVYNEMMAIGQAILSAGSALYSWAVSVGEQIVNGLKAGLHISSPGIMYHMVKDELTGIGGLLHDHATILGTGAASMGNSMVSGLGNTITGHSGSSINIRNQIRIDGSNLTVSQLETTLLLLLEKYNNKVISANPVV